MSFKGENMNKSTPPVLLPHLPEIKFPLKTAKQGGGVLKSILIDFSCVDSLRTLRQAQGTTTFYLIITLQYPEPVEGYGELLRTVLLNDFPSVSYYGVF